MRRTKKQKKLTPKDQAQALITSHKGEFVAGIIGFLGLIAMIAYFLLSVNFDSRELSIQPKPTVTLFPSASPTPSAKYYQLQEGESLWDVAQKEYGNPYLYPTLVELNNLESPDVANPGMRLRVR